MNRIHSIIAVKMKTGSLLLLWLVVHLKVGAQEVIEKKSGTVDAGSWTIQQYLPDILRVTFKPVDYPRNENLSDAVILSPSSSPVSITSGSEQHNLRLKGTEIKVTI